MNEKKSELEAEKSTINANLFHSAVGAIGGGWISHSVVTRSKNKIDCVASDFHEFLHSESYNHSPFTKIKEELSKFTVKEDLHENAKELFEKYKQLNLQSYDDIRAQWNEEGIVESSDSYKKLEAEAEKLKQSFDSKFKNTLKYIKSVNNSKNAGIIIAAGTAIIGFGAFVLSSISTSKNIAENKRKKPTILISDNSDNSASRSR